jgi:hypothetical protein
MNNAKIEKAPNSILGWVYNPIPVTMPNKENNKVDSFLTATKKRYIAKTVKAATMISGLIVLALTKTKLSTDTSRVAIKAIGFALKSSLVKRKVNITVSKPKKTDNNLPCHRPKPKTLKKGTKRMLCTILGCKKCFSYPSLPSRIGLANLPSVKSVYAVIDSHGSSTLTLSTFDKYETFKITKNTKISRRYFFIDIC